MLVNVETNTVDIGKAGTVVNGHFIMEGPLSQLSVTASALGKLLSFHNNFLVTSPRILEINFAIYINLSCFVDLLIIY